MLLVIPYCANDAALVSQLLDYLPQVGPYKDHSCLLATTPGRKDLAEFKEKAESCFAEVHTYEAPASDGAGWPYGPNGMFSATARHIFSSPEFTDSWLWLEADCTPTRSGWLDEIQAEYFAAHQPFLGAVVATRVMRDGVEIENGQHMTGCGIYPKDTPVRLALFDTIKFSPHPFDCYLQWEIVPQCHPTGLIQNVWNTKGAVRKGNTISVKPGNDVARGATIRHKACALIHGVKDGSLMKIFRKDHEIQEAA